MIHVVLVIQEEEDADEFRPEPAPEDRGRQGARYRWTKNHPVQRSNTEVVLKVVIEMMEEEFGMATAGAGNDEDESDDGDL